MHGPIFNPPYSWWIAGPGAGQVALGAALERQDCLEPSWASAPSDKSAGSGFEQLRAGGFHPGMIRIFR